MLTSIQDALLKMIGWFDNYCQENHITYFAAGGTLLGAIRHAGFIPWDDDIDVILPRPDYERLIKTFNNGNSIYNLESPYSENSDFLFSYSKLYDSRTTIVENVIPPCRRGLYIDVFPLDGVGDRDWKKNFNKFDRMNMLLMTRTCSVRQERETAKNIALSIMQLIPDILIDNKKLSRKVDKVASSFGYEDSKYIGNLMGAYRSKEVFPKSYLGKPTRYKFENIEIYSLEHYDKYLSHIYGNWKQLPPEEKRHGAHNWISVDLEHSYENSK